jgi:hypothetical protein
MRVARWLSSRTPVVAGIGDGLVRTSLILRPQGQAGLLVPRLDQFFWVRHLGRSPRPGPSCACGIRVPYGTNCGLVAIHTLPRATRTRWSACSQWVTHPVPCAMIVAGWLVTRLPCRLSLDPAFGQPRARCALLRAPIDFPRATAVLGPGSADALAIERGYQAPYTVSNPETNSSCRIRE